MEVALEVLLPKILGTQVPTQIIRFECKDELLDNLFARLSSYASWLPEGWRIIVLVDRDREDCVMLKKKLEATAKQAKLSTKSSPGRDGSWAVANRIVIEELESWYFGDWDAVTTAYPKVSGSIPKKEGYRDPDAIQGGTWEALERILKRAGYFEGGLRKIELARAITPHIEPERNRSRSFQVFRDALRELIAS